MQLNASHEFIDQCLAAAKQARIILLIGGQPLVWTDTVACDSECLGVMDDILKRLVHSATPRIHVPVTHRGVDGEPLFHHLLPGGLEGRQLIVERHSHAQSARDREAIWYSALEHWREAREARPPATRQKLALVRSNETSLDRQ